MNIDCRVKALLMFGSGARGDSDELSDVDVLAIVRNNSGFLTEDDVKRYLILKNIKDATVVWYGENRYKRMLQSGELFCWHIFQEGKIIYEQDGFFSELPVPREYKRALEDIESFCEIAESVAQNMKERDASSVYELGLLYVCIRNVAMSASAILAEHIDFTRYSPYNFGHDIPMPMIAKDCYVRAMRCRLASQRGLAAPPGVDPAEVMRFYEDSSRWMKKVRSLVSRRLRGQEHE